MQKRGGEVLLIHLYLMHYSTQCLIVIIYTLNYILLKLIYFLSLFCTYPNLYLTSKNMHSAYFSLHFVSIHKRILFHRRMCLHEAQILEFGFWSSGRFFFFKHWKLLQRYLTFGMYVLQYLRNLLRSLIFYQVLNSIYNFFCNFKIAWRATHINR